MAKQQCLYDALIKIEDEQQWIKVDIFNLPYDKINAENQLIILGDVDMGKSRGRPWPDLSNVLIFGDFDCSSFSITPETVLPKAFKNLICKFSINDLGVLVGKLPGGVDSVVVRTALMNNIKKNKNEALDSARSFAQTYPKVVVSDEKQTLKDVLLELDRVSHAPEKQSGLVESNPDVAIKDKSDQWLTLRELVVHCASLSDKIASLSSEICERYVRMARSPRARLNIKTAKLKRAEDMSVVQCVHIESVPVVVDYILSYISKQEQAKQNTPVKKEDNKQPVSVSVSSEKQQFFFGDDEVKIVEIKKYISKSAWTQIRSKCSCNTTALLRMLNDIQCINVQPASTKGASVLYIANGGVQKSRTIKFKSVHCLCQGFGSIDNNSRIVWGVSGNTFVCQKFFPHHSVNDEYQRYIRGLNIDANKLDFAEYLYVPDLIQDLSGVQNIIADFPQTDNNSVIQQEVQTNIPEPQLPVKEPIVKTDSLTKEKNMTSEKVLVEKTDGWVNLYSLHCTITEQFEFLQKQQSDILTQMITVSDTSQLLKLNQDLRLVLENKQVCETALEKLKSINKSLLELRSELKLH